MKIKGIGRTRDKKGNISAVHFHDYVMCIHTNVGGGYKTMLVLVAEIYEDTKTEEPDRR